MNSAIFFDSWHGLLRVFISGSCAYLALVMLLRLSGKRTLSKMSAFDLVVTVALGSTLATILLTKDVAITEGVVAFSLLITLQYIITWSSIRSDMVRKLVKAEPTLLFFEGEWHEDGLKSQRVTHSEVVSAMRAQGCVSLQQVAAVVLETDGSMAVMKKPDAAHHDYSTLENVSGFPLDKPPANV